MDESTSKSGVRDISGAIRRAVGRQRGEASRQASDPQTPDASARPGTREHEGVEPLVIGESVTTFGNEPWWTNKNWNRLPSSGGVNGLRIHNGVVGNLAVCGGSVRGRRHQLAGQPNDDSFDITTVTDEANNPAWLVTVVCDGVGSASFSDTGAARTAAHAAALVAHSLRARPAISVREYEQAFSGQCERFLALVTSAVRDDVQKSAPGWVRQLEFTPPADVELGELQTTLTICVMRANPNPDGQYDGVVISVGDSPILRLRRTSITRIGVDNDRSEVWSTATSGALGATAAHTQMIHLEPDEALLVASDGIANFLTHDGQLTALGKHAVSHWLTPIDAITFARDLSFDLASADDDRTAVMIWPRHA